MCVRVLFLVACVILEGQDIYQQYITRSSNPEQGETIIKYQEDRDGATTTTPPQQQLTQHQQQREKQDETLQHPLNL